MIKEEAQKSRLSAFVYCFAISFLILLLTSKSSPLYPFNDWVDANAFFTVGKGMILGKVPYRDLFEQKGPLLYLIYGLGYLISNTTFLGVFIIEVISFTIFLYYSQKVILMFLNEKASYLVLLAYGVLLCTSKAFVQGGSAEELCFPFLAASLYYLLKYLQNREISYRCIFANGLFAGCVLMIKYNLSGFWIAWLLFVLIYPLKNKDYRKALLSFVSFASAAVLPFLLWCAYFLAHNSLPYFIDTYFLLNLYVYSTSSGSFILSILNAFKLFFEQLISNGLVLVFLFLGSFFWRKSNKKLKRPLIFILLPIIIGIYIGGKAYDYYILLLLPFILFSLTDIAFLIGKLGTRISNERIKKALVLSAYILVIGSGAFFAYKCANYSDWIGKDKNTLFEYKFAQIVNREQDKTILNYGFLDMGLYTALGTVPSIRYFEKQNIEEDRYPDNMEEQNRYIAEGKTMFVLMRSDGNPGSVPKLYDNYICVSIDEQIYEGRKYDFLLFKRNR